MNWIAQITRQTTIKNRVEHKIIPIICVQTPTYRYAFVHQYHKSILPKIQLHPIWLYWKNNVWRLSPFVAFFVNDKQSYNDTTSSLDPTRSEPFVIKSHQRHPDTYSTLCQSFVDMRAVWAYHNAYIDPSMSSYLIQGSFLTQMIDHSRRELLSRQVD